MNPNRKHNSSYIFAQFNNKLGNDLSFDRVLNIMQQNTLNKEGDSSLPPHIHTPRTHASTHTYAQTHYIFQEA